MAGGYDAKLSVDGATSIGGKYLYIKLIVFKNNTSCAHSHKSRSGENIGIKDSLGYKLFSLQVSTK